MELLLSLLLAISASAASTSVCAKLTESKELTRNLQCSNFNVQKRIQTKLPQANFMGSDLTHSDWHQSDLSKGNFKNTVMDRMSAQKTDFSDSLFLQTRAHAAHFDYSDFTQTDWSDSNIQGNRFTGAKFLRANMQRANLAFSDLRFANFTDADLRGADLTSCIWYGAVFKGAVVDKATKLPFPQQKAQELGIIEK